MMQRLYVVAATALLLAGGCNTPDSRPDASLSRRVVETSDLRGTFAYMTDNAVLADMAVNDSHFLPHRALLNDLGRRRLGRLVSLMEAYAGTIRFNTASSDEELIEQRLATIMDFLSEAGIETEQEVVRCDMPGGKGMSAVEAILIKVNEGTYDPEQRGSQSGAERSFTGN